MRRLDLSPITTIPAALALKKTRRIAAALAPWLAAALVISADVGAAFDPRLRPQFHALLNAAAIVVTILAGIWTAARYVARSQPAPGQRAVSAREYQDWQKFFSDGLAAAHHENCTAPGDAQPRDLRAV